jgi:hypothetical protein
VTRRPRATLVAPAGVVLLAAMSLPVGAQESPVDTLALRAHTYFLAHETLQGRGTGTRGADVAAAYLASQCRRLGLEPVGPDYFQPVPLERARVLETTRLTLARAGRERTYTYPVDFVPNIGSKRTLVDFEGPAVYVGDLDELAPGALDALPLEGAVAVTLGVPDPGAAAGLADRAVAGLIHLVGDERALEAYHRSRGVYRLYHRDSTVPSSFFPPLPSVLAGPAIADGLLAGTPLLAGRDMAPHPLPVRVRVALGLAPEPIEAANVVCLLRGAAPGAADRAITLTAHHDHLGIGVPDERGDSVYNGFSDNAAGGGMVLAAAAALQRDRPRPAHSVLLLFFTGEEAGLLGSDYYVTRPLWPLYQVRAVINLDAGAPPAPPVTWRLAGVDSSGLGATALAIAAARGWTATTSPPRPNSDYFPFIREGVPAVFIIPGAGPYEGLTADSSDALRRRWDRYHEPDDEWAEDFPFGGLRRYAEFALSLVRAIDSSGTDYRASLTGTRSDPGGSK